MLSDDVIVSLLYDRVEEVVSGARISTNTALGRRATYDSNIVAVLRTHLTVSTRLGATATPVAKWCSICLVSLCTKSNLW